MNAFRRILKLNSQNRKIFTVGLGITSCVGVKKLYDYFSLKYAVKSALDSTRDFSVKVLEGNGNTIAEGHSVGFFVAPGLFLTSYHGLEIFLNKDNLYSHVTISNPSKTDSSHLMYVHSN